MKKNKIILIVLIITIIMLTMGVTYAYIRKTLTQEESNDFTTLNCLDMELENIDINGNTSVPINLENLYPVSDDEGIKYTPYSFKITNKCNLPVLVDINLETLSTSELPINYVKLNYKNVSEDNSFTSLISELSNSTQKVISNSTNNKQLDKVYLAPNDPNIDNLEEHSSKVFEIKMWINEATTWEQAHKTIDNVESALDFQAKITLIESPTVSFSPNWNAASGTLLAAIENGDYLFTAPFTKPGASISNKFEKIIGRTEDDYGTSYYFRGNIENNYVFFADKCWKIVRIDGNKNIKLFYWGDIVNGQCTDNSHFMTSKFNENSTNNVYSGFMYGNVESSVFANGVDGANDNLYESTILYKLKEFYETYIVNNNLEGYLSDVIWCNNKDQKNLTNFVCPDTYSNTLDIIKNISRFTAYAKTDINNKNGNGKLYLQVPNSNPSEYRAYKIGLITAVEVRLAGNSGYLNTRSAYWTMSFGGNGKEWIVWNNGALYNDNDCYVTETYGVRPAVSLIPTVTIEPGGDGTANNPYVIEVPELEQS